MKKIYYFPGLISALVIPLLFWYYGSRKFGEIKISVMDIWLPAKLKNNSDRDVYSISFEPVRNWNYKKIKVAPGTAKQNSPLYVSELENLRKRNEKESGIEFMIDQNNTYGDFASVLNDLHISKQDQYMVDLEKTGHIFVIYTYIDPSTKLLDECLLCNDFVTWVSEENDRFGASIGEKMTTSLTTLPEQSFYLIFGFLIFLNISMFSIKEKFQS